MDAIIIFNSSALGNVKTLQKFCGDTRANCVIALQSIDEIKIKEV